MKRILNLIKKHKIVSGLILAIVVLGGYYFFNKQQGQENEVKSFQAEKVSRSDLKVVVNGSGQIQAKSQVDLKPQVAGDGLDVVGVFVSNNQKVKKGDLIATLDNESAEENVRDDRLALETAQIQYKKIAKENNNKTQEETWERNLAQNTVDQKINALKDALEKLEDYKIKAPFDGIVTGLDLETGDSISRDDILASVITEKMQAEISLNEIDAAKIKTGDSAVLSFDVLEGGTILGQVSRIDTIGTVNSGVVSYDVVVSFENKNEALKPGMSVEVDIEVASAKNVLLIPNSFIKENSDGEEYVIVKESSDLNAKTERRLITTGITDNIQTEVTSGLKEGEMVTEELNNNKKTTASSGGESRNLFQMGGSRPPRN